MEIFPFVLAKMLFVAFLFGIQSGIVFDFGRAMRGLLFGEVKSKKIKKAYSAKLPFSKRKIREHVKKSDRIFKNVVIFFCDFLWIVYSFFGLVKINYSYNEGGIRFFTILAMIIGFTVYYFSISHLAVFLLEVVSFVIRYIFLSVFDMLSIPFLKLYNILVKKIKKRCENIRLRIEKKKKKVYNVSEEVCENVCEDNKRITVKITIRKNQKKGRIKNEKN